MYLQAIFAMMKRYLLRLTLTLMLGICSVSGLLAQREGDTVVVNLFEFGDHENGGYARWFEMPDDGESYERVWLQYRLRCPEWRCGQWDYLAYIFLSKPTGQYDTSGNQLLDTYEIGRYITPYGSQLPLDWDFTWYFDVTDYMPLLRDSVRIDANSIFYGWITGGYSQLLELKMLKIKGTPARKPLYVRRQWHGAPAYGIDGNPIENFLTPKELDVPADAPHTRFKFRVTGHGFGDQENCAEFCKKEHLIKVDGAIAHSVIPWRPDCGLNPVFPQNGTWIYDRAGWCPGDAVGTSDLELTPWLTPGDTVELDYDVQSYVSRRRPGVDPSTPYWMIETQTIHYEAPAFQVDASVEEIISPSRRDVHRRHNLICDQPVVVIRNTGADTLRSLTIRYGTREGRKYRYMWTGELPIAATDTVELGPLEWGKWSEQSTWFDVEVSEPNGQADPYPRNNRMSSPVDPVRRLESPIEIILIGNRAARDNFWELRDANDSLFLSRPAGSLRNEAQRRDTLNLPAGCYRLTVNDMQGDGLDFGPYNEAGRGNIIIRTLDPPSQIYLEPNFGRATSFWFTIGYDMFNDTLNLYNSRTSGAKGGTLAWTLHPNPARETVTVQATLSQTEPVRLTLLDPLGRELRSWRPSAGSSVNEKLDVSGLPAGLYFLRMEGNGWTEGRRLLIEN